MHCVDVRRTGRKALPFLASVAIALTVWSCADGLAPQTLANAPQALSVTALRPGVIRLQWTIGPEVKTTAASGSVQAYGCASGDGVRLSRDRGDRAR
jgi:hypothetical protein